MATPSIPHETDNCLRASRGNTSRCVTQSSASWRDLASIARFKTQALSQALHHWLATYFPVHWK